MYLQLNKLQKLIHQTIQTKSGKHLYLVRHGQSMGNKAGSIIGWTDSKLSGKGRKQANQLFRGLHKNIPHFTSFHSSDLTRCKDTLNICLGFSNQNVIYSEKLRELHFGDQEGEHYDSLPDEEKNKISSLDYKPPNGETWPQARARAINYFKTLPEGHHLVSSHGGLICALAYHLGIKHVVPNCSMLSVQFCSEKNDLKKVHFLWEFTQK